jgi:hypothetical protein
MQKVLTFNDNGLEPTRGLKFETSKVRKTASSTQDVAKWPAQAGVEPASSYQNGGPLNVVQEQTGLEAQKRMDTPPVLKKNRGEPGKKAYKSVEKEQSQKNVRARRRQEAKWEIPIEI